MRKTMKFAAAIMFTGLVSACADVPDREWHKRENYYAGVEPKDLRECNAEGDKAKATVDWRIHNVEIVRQDVIAACMRGREYE
jgi:hypothetical protein